jgi:DNA-binding transcriptional MerR regulator
MNDKESFNLEEVTEIVGIPPHIVRYWEAEFQQVEPERDELGQRIYSRKDLDVIVRIHYLLYEGKYTIADTKIELAKEFG